MRTAVVSGASSGIGKEVCGVLLDRGWNVVGISRRLPNLKHVKFDHIQADLQSCKSRIVVSGRIHALVNCAGGIVHFDAASAFKPDQVESEFSKNFLSAVRLTSAIVPRFEHGGSIVNISSVYGIRPQTYAPGYSAAKAALINYTQFLANHLAPKNIRVNAVCPGHVMTPAWEKSAAKNVDRHIPARRMGKPHDVAALVAFLLSDEAQWITGSCFVIDGGCLSRLNCTWQ